MKTRVNAYELGGGRILSNLLQAPLSFGNLNSLASVCIVLDLSKPGNCLESLMFWMEEVKKYADAGLSEMKAQKPEELKKLLMKRQSYWSTVPAQADKKEIKLSKVSITVIGAKYDLFAQ
jgi:hypothetical protein